MELEIYASIKLNETSRVSQLSTKAYCGNHTVNYQLTILFRMMVPINLQTTDLRPIIFWL